MTKPGHEGIRNTPSAKIPVRTVAAKEKPAKLTLAPRYPDVVYRVPVSQGDVWILMVEPEREDR